MNKFFSNAGEFLKFFAGFVLWFFAVSFFEQLAYAGFIMLLGTTVGFWAFIATVVYFVWNGYYSKSLAMSMKFVDRAFDVVGSAAKKAYAFIKSPFGEKSSNAFSGYDFT